MMRKKQALFARSSTGEKAIPLVDLSAGIPHLPKMCHCSLFSWVGRSRRLPVCKNDCAREKSGVGKAELSKHRLPDLLVLQAFGEGNNAGVNRVENAGKDALERNRRLFIEIVGLLNL